MSGKIVLMLLAANFFAASEPRDGVCSNPVGFPPHGSGADAWEGLYAETGSCTSLTPGDCVKVSQEMFDSEFAHARAKSYAVTGLTISAMVGKPANLWFRRYSGAAPAGRLLWVKYKPNDAQPQPVFARAPGAPGGFCSPILLVEPIPGV